MNGITHEIIPGCLQHYLFDRVAPTARPKYSIIDNASTAKQIATGCFAVIFYRMSRITTQRGNKMIALRQIKRVPKNHKIVIEVPNTIQENQMMEVILLCKELPKDDKAIKIAQLKDSQHDPLFLSDMQAISDDFFSVDNEAW